MMSSLAQPKLVQQCTSTRRVELRPQRAAVASRATRQSVRCAAFAPPPVSVTKRNFLEAWSKPMPAIYNNVLQELLVTQHFIRYSKSYQYDAVFAVGLLTVFEQLFDNYRDEETRAQIFAAYISALGEKADQYKRDAAVLEAWAKEQSADSLVDFASAEGDAPSMLKELTARTGDKSTFKYSKFFAIGLFRLLELSEASDPAALEKLVAAVGVSKESVDKDLSQYRDLLSKLNSARELMEEFLARERKTREERNKAAETKASEPVSETAEVKSE